MTAATQDVARRVADVQGRIVEACRRSGRPPSDVVLIGASKGQPVERLQAAFAAGVRTFGENRIQEAQGKIPRLPPEIEWVLIGPLQSNKVAAAVELFRVIHSVDRLKIARALDRQAARRGVRLQGFIEVNLGEEGTKHGFAPGELPQILPQLERLEHIDFQGLMAIPPYNPDPEASRPWFVQLRKLAERVASRPGWQDFAGRLSMGMSLDFEVAIEEGATHIRVGTDLFGPRE